MRARSIDARMHKHKCDYNKWIIIAQDDTPLSTMHITKHFDELDLERIWDDFNSRGHLTDATELLRNHSLTSFDTLQLVITPSCHRSSRAHFFGVVLSKWNLLHSAVEIQARFFFSFPYLPRVRGISRANSSTISLSSAQRRVVEIPRDLLIGLIGLSTLSTLSTLSVRESRWNERPCASDSDRIHRAWGLMRITRRAFLTAMTGSFPSPPI